MLHWLREPSKWNSAVVKHYKVPHNIIIINSVYFRPAGPMPPPSPRLTLAYLWRHNRVPANQGTGNAFKIVSNWEMVVQPPIRGLEKYLELFQFRKYSFLCDWSLDHEVLSGLQSWQGWTLAWSWRHCRGMQLITKKESEYPRTWDVSKWFCCSLIGR